MLDTFTVYAPAGKTTDVDGMESPAYTTIGTTRGKVQGRSKGDTSARRINVAGVDRLVVDAGLHVAVDSPAPAQGNLGIGWEYVLTTAGPATPADLVESRWLVVDSPAKSFMTARRLDVVRLS